MLQKILSMGVASLCYLVSVDAQETTSSDTSAAKPNPTTITASADVYYRYDFAKTTANNFTSFTNSHNSFELGMASVKAEHSLGSVGFLADIGFGQRAEDFTYNDDKTRLAIKQLNLSYTTKAGVKFTAGTWATHVGYELADAYLNRNYSMSYMFSYGPFSHTGIKAEKSFGRMGLMLGVANPTDFKSFSDDEKYIIGQLSTVSLDESLKLWLNYQGGKFDDSSRVKQVDVVLTAALAEKFSIGVNATAASYQFKNAEKDFGDMNTWWGTALYLNFDPKEWLDFTLRSEYFSDSKGLNVFSGYADGGSLVATTLSMNLKSGNLTFIPELRFEQASEEIFIKNEDGEVGKSAASAIMAITYNF